MTQKRLSYNSFLSVKNPRHPDIKPQESPRVSSFYFLQDTPCKCFLRHLVS